MGEKLVFSGIPQAGFAMYFLYGIVLLPAGVLLLLMLGPRLSENICNAALIIFILAFGALLLGLAFDSLRTRTLEIDDFGVRLKKGGTVRWEALWGEVRAIGTTSLGGKTPRTGFYIKTEQKYYHVNTRDDLGPRDKLVEIFRALAKRCSGSGVISNDLLGWATDLGLQFALPAKPDSIQANAAKGVWHDSKDPYRAVGAVAKFCIGIIVLGAVLLVIWHWWLNDIELLPLLGISSLIAGLSFLVLIYADYRMRPVSIKFDDSGMEMRFPSRKTQYLIWKEIMICGYDAEHEVLRIKAHNHQQGWMGFFAPTVGEAISIIYAATRDKNRPPPPLDK